MVSQATEICAKIFKYFCAFVYEIDTVFVLGEFGSEHSERNLAAPKHPWRAD